MNLTARNLVSKLRGMTKNEAMRRRAWAWAFRPKVCLLRRPDSSSRAISPKHSSIASRKLLFLNKPFAGDWEGYEALQPTQARWE